MPYAAKETETEKNILYFNRHLAAATTVCLAEVISSIFGNGRRYLGMDTLLI